MDRALAMSFGLPLVLWFLLLPAAWLARELLRRRPDAQAENPRIARAEAGLRGVELRETPSRAAGRRGPRLWLCAGAAFAIVALARPQWGRIDEPVFDQSREVILALDLSRSMLSTDVKPSRLDRSKLLVQSLLDHLKGERVGLIVFSGTAFLQSPLSADYEILREFLPALNPEFLPEGGTNYTAMIETALEAFSSGGSSDRYLVVLSDGEATDDDWAKHLPELKARGVRVIGLGVGTPAGSMIPDGAGGFMKDDSGAVVMSKLESGTLRQLAEATKGAYRDASSWVDLAALIQSTVDAGQKGHFVENRSIRRVERYQWALAPALLCLLASFWVEFPVRARARDVRMAPGRRPGGRAGGTAPGPGAKSGPDAAQAASTTAAAGLSPTRTQPASPSPASSSAVLLLAALAVTAVATRSRALTAPGITPAPGSSGSALTGAGPSGAAPSGPAPGAASESPSAPSAGLSRVIARLADAPSPSALDWSELARDTLDWAHRLQEAGQAVPEGPVRDGLAAVANGARMDAQAADWPSLRSELEQLLNRPEQKDSQDQNQDSKDQKQDSKDRNSQQPQQKDSGGSSGKDSKPGDGTSNQSRKDAGRQPPSDGQSGQKPSGGADKSEGKPPQSGGADGTQGDRKQTPASQQPQGGKGADGSGDQSRAFGGMDQKNAGRQQPQAPMQKVGGVSEQRTGEADQIDPALAGSLERLHQLTDKDSPAELFQLMQKGEPAPPPDKKGKNW